MKNPIRNLSVPAKLSTGLLLLLSFAAIFGFILSRSLSTFNKSFRQIQDQFIVLDAISTIEVASIRSSSAADSYMLSNDPKWVETYNLSIQNLHSALTALSAFERDVEDFDEIEDIQNLSKETRDLESSMFALIEDKEALDSLDEKHHAKGDQLALLISQFTEKELEEMTEILEANTASIKSIQTIILAFLLLAGTAASTGLVAIGLSISRPIVSLTKTVEEITTGNLEAKAKVTSKDEVGKLATAFNTMTQRLQHTLSELHEEKALLLASIQSTPVGFVMIGPAGKIEVSNSIFQTICSGKCTNIQEIHNHLQKSINFYDQYAKAVNTRQPVYLQDVALDDKILRIVISPIIVPENKKQLVGAILIIEDVTEAKLIERSKDEFLAVASHEMRTPLTAIVNNTSFLRDKYLKDAKGKEDLDTLNDIYVPTMRLLNIVNNFLSTSRLELGKMKFAQNKVNLTEMLNEIADETGVLAAQKSLYLKLEAPQAIPEIVCDEQKTREIFYNLVNNAINYTKAGGIIIKASSDTEKVEVRIIDTGVGISPQNQKLLFNKFQQAGEDILTRQQSTGTGLGLYISRLLAKGMGGNVQLENSELNKGSTFVFTMPLVKTDKRS